MKKVSVVIPTYCPGNGLDRLVASLDAQTMSTDDYEVIFVDDGSPDDTFVKLTAIAAERPHVRAHRIENSGWPCRPRNIGTDLAVGEYVAYMDHDDLLYPDALRGGYEHASAAGADVLNGKEARTHDAEWAIPTYVADVANSRGRLDQHPLLPMNPHKMYRRQFLIDHDIRFIEDGRMMWEDIFFNVSVARHAEVITTMSSIPYYHWYATPGSGSKSFQRSSADYWKWLRNMMAATVNDLSERPLERDQLLVHQHRGRILASFNGAYSKLNAAEQSLVYDNCRALQSDFVPESLDEALNTSQLIRAQLLRANERALLEALPSHDPGIPGSADITGATWDRGVLTVRGTARWFTGSGRTHALRRQGDRIVKALPEQYARVLPPETLDMTDEILEATVQFGLRSRPTRETWMTPSESKVFVTDDGSDVSFTVEAIGHIDPATTIFGRPLERVVWDINARCTLGRTAQQLRATSNLEAAISFNGETIMIAYANADGYLSLDIGETVKYVAAVGDLRVDRATVIADSPVRVSIPVEGVDISGHGTAPTTVTITPLPPPPPQLGTQGQPIAAPPEQSAEPKRRKILAHFVADDEGARLEFALPENVLDALIYVRTGRIAPEKPWELHAGEVRSASPVNSGSQLSRGGLPRSWRATAPRPRPTRRR